MTLETINGVQYFFEKSGDGVPVVLLHGFTGYSVNWRFQRDQLSQQFTVITIDLLGHGKTESPPDAARYQMEHVADDVATIIQYLTNESVNLLGYSMGGRLALYIAVHYPRLVRKLVLESASPGLSSADERQARIQSDTTLADYIEREGIERFVDYWTEIPLFESQRRLPSHLTTQLRGQRLQNSTLGLANSLRGMGTGVQPSMWDQLREILISVLLVVGELDTKYVAIAHQMASRLPTSTLKVISGVGHTTHLEQPHQFLNMVVNFLTGER